STRLRAIGYKSQCSLDHKLDENVYRYEGGS
ncbi:unnamed protein product, partial [marine sediment metagenome]